MSDLARLKILDDPTVRGALSWYLDVAENRRPAKFRIAATVNLLNDWREIHIRRDIHIGFSLRRRRDLWMNEITIFASDFHNSHSSNLHGQVRLDSPAPRGIYTPIFRPRPNGFIEPCLPSPAQCPPVGPDACSRVAGGYYFQG